MQVFMATGTGAMLFISGVHEQGFLKWAKRVSVVKKKKEEE